MPRRKCCTRSVGPCTSELLSRTSPCGMVGTSRTSSRTMQTKELQDVHYQKMKVYPEVANWWYMIIFVVCFALGLGMLYAMSSGLPW
ncbi:hypothetical protein OF83DRAFT_1201092, partial [Amylostereum chailletii]